MDESVDLCERLQRHARFIAIVAEQLDALDRGDHDRLVATMEERRLLEEEDGAQEPGWDDDSPPVSLYEDLENALAALERRFEADRLLKDRLDQISDGALRSARSLSLRSSLKAGRYTPAALRGERLDLRL